MQNNLGMKTRTAGAAFAGRIFGKVKYLNHETNSRIVDLSATGVALDPRRPFLRRRR